MCVNRGIYVGAELMGVINIAQLAELFRIISLCLCSSVKRSPLSTCALLCNKTVGAIKKIYKCLWQQKHFQDVKADMSSRVQK